MPAPLFKTKPQRNGDLVVCDYIDEDGQHLGAVGRIRFIDLRCPLVLITKPISLAGAGAIIERLAAEPEAKTKGQSPKPKPRPKAASPSATAPTE